MTATKLGPRKWITLVLIGLFGQFAWTIENMYLNVFLYNTISTDPDYIARMVAWSAIAATLTTLLMGALSDRVGKRKLFICGGYLAWGVSIWSFAWIRTDVIHALFPSVVSAATVGVSLTILMDCVMTFFGSSANDACFNAWLTDMTDSTNRGKAEGVNAMMPLLAILVVFGGFMGFDLGLSQSWVSIFTIIGCLVIVIGLAGLFLLEEPRVETGENQRYFANIFYGFRPSVIRENTLLYLTLLAVAVFNIAIQIFMPYLILYYNVSLGMDNYVLIMAPAILLAAIFTFLYGPVYDKLGFRKAIVAPIALLMAGCGLLYLFRSTVPVFLGSLAMMCGYLGGGAMLGALVRDFTPRNKSGMFQGLRIFAQVLIPGVIGPAIGAAILRNAETVLNDDGTTSFIPNANIYLGAFLAGVVIWLVLIPIFNRLRREKAHAA